MPIVLFSTHDRAMQLAEDIRKEFEIRKRESSIQFAPVPEAAQFRDEYQGTNFALIPIFGAERHMQAGLDTLSRATRVRIRCAIIIDQAGHDFCVRHQEMYPNDVSYVRFCILMGDGVYQRQSGLCHPMGRPLQIAREWSERDTRAIVDRVIKASRKDLSV